MSWFYGSNSTTEGQNSSSSSTPQESVWSSWTDAAKWQDFAAKAQLDAIKLAEVTQKEALKLAEVTQKEAIKFAEVASHVAAEKAAVLSKHAQETRDHYDPKDIGSSILYGLGIPNHNSKYDSSKPRQVALEDLDFVYITENVIAMPFPADCRKKKCPAGMNDILDVSSYLESHHKGHYMILNISEESYDYALFDNQVLEYHFPGHPAPPLGVLFKICVAVESWLDADERNVVIIHCLTGKGRTAALTSCVLSWMGEFASPMEALHYICIRRNTTVEILTIPSQRRYIQYFGNMLDGIRPRSEAILLRRVIMSSIPKFEKKTTRIVRNEKEVFLDLQGTSQVVEEIVDVGCAPYVQLFKCGSLIATATPQCSSETNNGEALTLSWINCKEGSTSFTVNAVIRGDILLRCRHADSSGNAGGEGQRVSMFRAAFHTGYVPSGVLRLTKEQLDGAGTDGRFEDEFFIDLIFAPVVKAAPNTTTDTAADGSTALVANKKVSDEGLEIIESSEKYEQTLHKDTRFWESIANRKLKSKKRKNRKFTSDKLDPFIIDLSNNASDEQTQDMTWINSATVEKENVSGVSDEDLIAQLAYAEQLLGSEIMSSTPSEADGRNSPALVVVNHADMAPNAASHSIADDVMSVPSTNASDILISSTDAEVLVTNQSLANKELLALEALERELGLGDLNLFSTSATTSSSANVIQSPIAVNMDSNYEIVNKDKEEDATLDELEQYLHSINNTA